MHFQSIDKDRRIIKTIEPRLFRKPRERSFQASKRIAGEFWSWVELPGKTLVGDPLSFQLDSWLRDPPETPSSE